MNVRQSASEIEEQAARWVLRLDREGRTAAVTAGLQDWLDQDTRRVGALLQAEAAFGVLDRARLAPARPRLAFPEFWRAAPRRMVAGGLAALAAAAVLGIVLINQPERFTTSIGEIRRLPLTDGSTASINTASKLEVDFDQHLRRVRLNEGEVWFQVAKDSTRPFRVDIGRIRVQAIGTAFSVRRIADGVEVRVTEGVVKTWVDGTSGRTVEVSAGAMSTVRETGTVSAPRSEPSMIDRDLAWRSGRLDLAGETLSQAVEKFNRHNARPLVLEDPALADQRLYGIFRLDDPDAFAASVALSFNASVTSDSKSIRLGRRDDEN